MIGRRDFIRLLVGAMASGTAYADELVKASRIGYVNMGAAPAPVNEIPVSFRERLADRGYVDGRNLLIEERFAGGRPERLPELFSDLLALRVDVLVAVGTQQALAAKRQTATVPIVFISSDPVGVGLVSSLAHPGSNLTGVSVVSAEYSSKWLELLKEAAPWIRRVAVLWNPDNPAIGKQVNSVRQAAPDLGVEVAVFPARLSDIEDSLAAIASTGVDGLVVTDDGVVVQLLERIGGFAAEHKLPALAGVRLKEGILMSYSYDERAVGRRVADYVDRILKGARPADLPVEQTKEFVLRINLKTAKSLGLTVPFSLIARADEVIE
jgi:putative ABC transport system substrate-binding protein